MPDQDAAREAAIALLTSAIQMGEGFSGSGVFIHFVYNGPDRLPMIELVSAEKEKLIMEVLGRPV